MPDHIHQRINALSPAKRALLEQMTARRAKGTRPRLADAPIAVIGLDCRFPDSPDPAAFWSLLRQGQDAIRPVPAERWDTESLYDPAFDAAGKVATRWGGFVEGVDRFDPVPFGISPREAAMLDPQHRLLLEVVWHALEDAGLTKQQLAGSACGVFASVYQRDYAHLALADEKGIDAYTASGTHHSIAAGRISYLFDLRGPSLVVDTACSSSLVAVHLACRSLLLRECDTAIVASANLMLSPAETMALSRWGVMAADGRSKAFDARADGFVRGEGAGALILKRLDEASREDSVVRAVIAGSAVLQDGRSHGLTAPNGQAQQAVIRAALHDADIEPEAISYIEAHGTGTVLGDPIEMEALKAIYDVSAAAATACAVGSVKTNLGHLEASAGMAGMIKTILSLQYDRVVSSLHMQRLNPAIDLTGSRLHIATEGHDWDGERYAAVSSFGMGGTNAHVLLRNAPSIELEERPHRAQDALLLPLSACSKEALRALVKSHATSLGEISLSPSGSSLSSASSAPSPLATDGVRRWCAAAGQRRSHHHLRLGIAADHTEMLRFELERLSDSGALDEHLKRIAEKRQTRRDRMIVMLFPGQGAQWRGMSAALSARYPVFRDSLVRCDALVRAQAGWSLLDELASPSERFEDIEVVQPLLFSYQVAMAELWQSFGIEPHLVIGHSMGEAAAAHICGALSLEDALGVILRRTALMRRVRGRGAMLSVPLPEADVERILAELRQQDAIAEQLSVAAVNGPTATVVAGDSHAVKKLAAVLSGRGVESRHIAVDVASHSPMVDELAAELTRSLAQLSPQPARIPMLSTVNGMRLSGTELDGAYWHRNLRQPVRLWSAISLLLEQDPILIELSPHPILLNTLGEAAQASGASLLPSSRREREQGVLMQSLGQLYELGFSLSWEQIAGSVRGHVPLPRYPFQRVRHWLPQPPKRRPRDHHHPLLGMRIDGPEISRWSGDITLSDAPFLRDHLVEGNCVVPGMGSVDMVLSALHQLNKKATLYDIVFERAIVVDPSKPLQLQLEVGHEHYALWGRDEGGWVRHNHGRLASADQQPAVAGAAVRMDIEQLKKRCDKLREGPSFYQRLNASGNHWGPAFQGVTRTYLGQGDVLAELSIPETIAAEIDGYAFHPAFLDACGQPMFEALGDAQRGPVVLAAIASVRRYGHARDARYSYIRVAQEQLPGSLTADVKVLDEQGQVIIEVGGLRIQFIHEAADHWLYQRTWRPAPAQPESLPKGDWLIVGDGPHADALHHALRQAEKMTWPEEKNGAFEIRRVAGMDPMPEEGDWNVLLPAPSAKEQQTVAARQQQLTDACMQLVEMSRRSAGRARLWLLSRGAAQHPSGEVRPWQAPLWGLAQVLRAEHPDAYGRAIDLDPMLAPEPAAQAVLDELCCQSDEPAVALRDDTRWVARLTRAPRLRQLPDWRLRPDASYVISGGLGGLGPEVARRLIERGARHLLLLSRTPLPPRRQWHEPSRPDIRARIERVLQIEQMGASVYVEAVDVADEAAMDALAQSWRHQRRPPVAGVIHAAGVQERRLLDQLDAASLTHELSAKVAGTENLWRVWGEQLELFVGFSSAATLLPSPLLGAYTAANAFLDAFAEAKRREHHHAISLSWGVWAAAGMAERYERQYGRTVVGMRRMAAARALDVMEQAHQAGLGHVGVMAMETSAWQDRTQASPTDPYLSELRPDATATESASPHASSTAIADLTSSLAQASEAERTEILTTYLLMALSQVLRTAPDQLDRDRPLTALGIDSLMALELRNRIRSDSGASIGVVDILRSHSFDALVSVLHERLRQPPSSSPSPPEDIDELVI